MLKTERTILRNFTASDLTDFYQYTSIDGVGEAAGWHHHATLDEAHQALENFIKNPWSYGIILAKTNQLIGHITVHPDSVDQDEKTKELGCVLHPDYQNQGIMTEVVMALLQDLFSNGIENVYACCFKENKQSQRLIEKCGFVFDQVGSFDSPSLNKTFVSSEYLLTKEQWEAQQNK